MKIIDLLNKIANEEEVPKKIRYNDTIYYYDETDDNELTRYRSDFDEWLFDDCYLNDEVEIIEENKENKIPEKLPIYDCIDSYNKFDINDNRKVINEIIDYLDYIKSKGDE